MGFKLIHLIFFSLLIYQVLSFALTRKERDTQDASSTIDNLLNDLKTGFNDFATKVQNNDVMKSISEQMQKFGQEVADGTKKFAEDTKKAFST